METWIILVGFLAMTLALTSAEDSCPSDADGCFRDAGLGSGDSSELCTKRPGQLDEAESCLQICGYATPPSLSEISRNVEASCSASPGCEGFLGKYATFRSCYNSTDNLKGLIRNVISKYNSRSLHLQDCMKLRDVRSCMRRTSSNCTHLGRTYSALLNLDKFDIALHICGAENVITPSRDDGCQDAPSNIKGNCGIACDLADVQTAGGICSLLQKQSDCMVRYSKECTEAQVTYLLPRILTYSTMNQLFMCNITVAGVIALPAIGLDCDFKRVLESCFNLQSSVGIPIQTIKKLLNADLPADKFCSMYGNKEDFITKCIKSAWSCTVPLTQIYATNAGDKDFDLSLGTLPLSERGLKLILNRCTSPGNLPGLACPNPGYNMIRTTPRRVAKFTPGVKLRTPQG